MDTNSDSEKNSVVQELTTGHYEESELSDPEQDTSVNDLDQGENYRETIRVYALIWDGHIDTHMSRAEDNPFAAPKQQPVGKFSVTLPNDYWLCRKMDSSLTLTQGYPSRSSKAGGLQRDQFVKYNKSQAKWYGFHSNQDKPAGNSAKLNGTYSQIAASSGLVSPAPSSRTLSQDTLRLW